MSRIFYLLIITLLSSSVSFSQEPKVNLHRDLIFKGDHIVYKGKKIALGPNAFFIDGQLSLNEISKYKYVYNSINEAAKHLTNGTETAPMTLYIAPWVYWIDNPDDPEIRISKTESKPPVGLEIQCDWLKFQGLTDNPRNVVLACNRGQTIGAKGNFTMLDIKGEGTSAENLTFGNYCNIDLVFPLNPKLNRAKRSSAIVQAQLIFANGDKVLARNVHFVSRLNLGPFWGSKRTLFDRCHFESTDDALNGTAVYLNCTFDFYSSKPFYRTNGTGAVFLNCDIQSFTREQQYFVKEGGPVATIDTRFTGKNVSYLGWKDIPNADSRWYQYNMSLNNQPVLLSKDFPAVTVDMKNKEILNAYRFESDNQTVYNTYNLLRGDDNWDPMNIKDKVAKFEKVTGNNYSSIPTLLTTTPSQKKLETGKDSLQLEAKVFRFGNYEVKDEKIQWEIAPEQQSLVRLKINSDGKCTVIPNNNSDDTKEVIIKASTSSGLEGASILSIAPAFLPSPDFKELPQISKTKEGYLELKYALNTTYEDQSLVTWYRCRDTRGSQPIEVLTSRKNKPLKTYPLSEGDLGYFIMASIAPKHQRCKIGTPKNVVFNTAIAKSNLKSNSKILIPNLENLSTKYQPNVLPGFWSMDSYAPQDTHEYKWEADNSKDPWYYGTGENGAANDFGFLQATKGARMRYSPVGDSFGDMKISFTTIPAKTAGQGFSSARGQYMDIGIKMNVQEMSGYALRIIRTNKYSDAVDFILVEYEKGKAKPISNSVTTSCFRPNCIISIEIKNNKLRVHAENPLEYFSQNYSAEVVKKVDLETEIKPNTFGGISIQHTGTIGSGATLIKDLKIEWF